MNAYAMLIGPLLAASSLLLAVPAAAASNPFARMAQDLVAAGVPPAGVAELARPVAGAEPMAGAPFDLALARPAEESPAPAIEPTTVGIAGQAVQIAAEHTDAAGAEAAEERPFGTFPPADPPPDEAPAAVAPAAPAPSAEGAAEQPFGTFPPEEAVSAPGVVPRGEEAVLGYPGWQNRLPSETADDFIPIEDRWRIGVPRWDRYPGRPGEYPFVEGHWWDPYNQNVVKGDYPIIGDDIFFIFSGISDTLFEARRLPNPSGPSTAEQDRSNEFFGQPDQLFFNQNLVLAFEIFRGNTAFKPRDWEIRFTPVLNLNYLDAGEQNAVNIDPADGTTRTDGHVGVQEALIEYHLGDISPWYDFISTRVGIQAFTSDFRGFIFSDNNLGVRLMGNWESNRQQYNLAYFRMLEKDTNSGLNRLFVNDPFDSREQDVVIANYYRQDTIWYGYTANFSFHYNGDHADHLHYDNNRFIVRPAAIGTIVEDVGLLELGETPRGNPVFHDVDAFYLGWAGEGHIGRLNVSHAFYQVLGRDERNPIAGQETDINAQMGALELSIDRDWVRFKGSFFYASGDGDPLDDEARGFDTILDNTAFAGAGFSYWNRQGFPLATTRTGLVQRLSLLPSFRTSKIEGQPEFVNPGIFIYNVGADLELTPKLRAFLNFNYLQFAEPEAVKVLLQQRGVDREIGYDYSIGLQYRPLLIDNVILVASAAALTPGDGFEDILVGETLYSTFLALTVTY